LPHPNDFPCWLSMLFSLIVVPLIGAIFPARQLQIYYSTAFFKDVVSMKAKIVDVSNEAENVMTEGKYTQFELLKSAFGSLSGRPDVNEDRTMAASKLLSSSRGMAFVVSFLLLPNALVYFALFASNPVYHSGCGGCAITFAIVAAVIAEGALLVLLTLYFNVHLHLSTDVWGFRTEIRLVLLFSVAAILSFALGALLPASSSAFQSSELLTVFMWCIVWSMTLYPLMVAYVQDTDGLTAGEQQRVADADLETSSSEAATNNKRMSLKTYHKSIERVPLERILEDPQLTAAFETHLCSELAVESLFFYQEATNWKLTFYNDPETKIKARGRKIVKAYVDPRGMYAINIGSTTLSSIQAQAANDKFTVDIFEPARIEVKRLLERGAVHRFAKTPAYKALTAHKGAKSSSMIAPHIGSPALSSSSSSKRNARADSASVAESEDV